MRKNTVTSKNRSPQNLTRFPNSRPKYTQTWHHVLKRPQPCINQIKYLHSQQPFYCSSWVRTWGEDAGFPRDLLEGSLGHRIGSAVERAYRRTDSFDRRRATMQAWADFCCG